MGTPQPPPPVKLIFGLLISEGLPLEQVVDGLKSLWGKIDRLSSPIPFHYTSYYEKEMGKLTRVYGSLAELSHSQRLVDMKLEAGRFENQWRREDGHRRVNVDPGYLSLSQLVLASTKPFAHRIYQHDGIWHEVTLIFQNGSFQPLPWTYPDYRDNVPLFNEYRKLLHQPDDPNE